MKPLFSFSSKQFSTGLSVNKNLATGFFKSALGVDLFKSKDYYGLPSQGLNPTLISGINDEIRAFVKNGSQVIGYGSLGYLYSFSSSGVPTVLAAGTESARTGGRSAIMYNDDGISSKLFYFSNTEIGYYNFSSATATNSYKTGLTSTYHDVIEFNGVLYFTNGDKVGSLNQATLNPSALQLPYGYTGRAIRIYKTYIAILAQSSNENISKIFLWDTVSTNGYNFEYTVPELCTALEYFRDDLAVFGSNVRLFNYGKFDVIAEISTNAEIRYCKTAYFNNTLYWKDYDRIMAYGSPSYAIKPVLYSPLKITYNDSGADAGAVIPLDTETSKFLVSVTQGSYNALLFYSTGNGGGIFESIELKAENNYIDKVVVHIEPIGSSFTTSTVLRIYDNGREIYYETKSKAHSSSAPLSYLVFDTTKTTYSKDYKPLNFFTFKLGLETTDNFIVKGIDIYGHPSESTPTE